MKRTLVRDSPTRLFHWLLVTCFAGGWLTSTSDRWLSIHIFLGYVMLGLIGFRLFVETGCSCPACIDAVQLSGHLEGPANCHPLPVCGLNYTPQVPVKLGDRVYWPYIATADAVASYPAWAGTTPLDEGPQPRGLDCSGLAQTAQQLVLTGGPSLLDTEGLTVLATARQVSATPRLCAKRRRWRYCWAA